MIKKYFNMVIIMTTLSTTGFVQCNAQHSQGKIREPAFAGQFYPADSSKLSKAIDYYLGDAEVLKTDKPIALIAPHAGYVYAGQIIADAYNQAKNYTYDLVVILGTNHTTAGFDKIGIYPGIGFQTPLGTSEIDTALAQELIESNKDCVYNEEVHSKEHSVEVQLPFIQHLFPNAKILPVVIGTPDYEMCTRFGKSLANLIKDKNALIAASSDLSHYPLYQDAVRVDKNTLDAAVSLNPQKLKTVIQDQMGKGINDLATCACGEGPILAAMAAAKELGAENGAVVSYANSGSSLIGNKQKVVGYGAVIFSKNIFKEEEAKPETESEDIKFELNDNDKKILLSFARKTIKQYLETETLPLARGFNPVLEKNLGAFVTLRINGELRGCIGYMREDLPLCEVVGTMAIQSAFNDQRFYPLTREEFQKVEIEISVLTPAKPISNYTEIVLGRDGVVIKKSGRQAVFLPQVAAEMNWNREELLDNLCRKAGLLPGDWKDAQLLTFQAEVFEESQFK